MQVPHSVSSVKFYGPVPAQLWLHLTINNGNRDDSRLVGNVTVINPQTGYVVCEMEEVKFTPLSQNDEGKPHFWFLEWQQIMDMSLSDVEPQGNKNIAIIETGDSIGQQLLEQLNEKGVPCQMFDMKTLQCFPNIVRQADVSQMLIEASTATDIVIVLAGQYTGNKQTDIELLKLTKSSFEATQKRSTMVLLYTMQHLTKQEAHSYPNVWIVTKGANPISANDKVDPLLSSIAGVALTISHEHPDVPVTLVDLPMSATDDICTVAAIAYMTNPRAK